MAAGTNPPLLIAQPAFNELAKQTREMLKEYHRRFPLESGLAREELRDPHFPLHAAAALGAQIDWPPQYLRAKPSPG